MYDFARTFVFWSGVIIAFGEAEDQQSDVIRWGGVFGGGSLDSAFVNLDFEYNAMPICCSTLSNRSQASHPKFTEHYIHAIKSKGHCTRSQVYNPSPYEVRHYLKSKELRKILDFAGRKEKLISFLASENEIRSVDNWIERVRVRSIGSHIEPTVDDFEYLSYFNITQSCHGGKDVKTWLEWIEPLSMHSRHPQSLKTFDEDFVFATAITRKSLKKDVPFISILNVEYILAQNGLHIRNYEINGHGRMYRNMKYMFDAGTSRFDSSLWFFTCMYSQEGIVFDQLLGSEYTLLEPIDFWSKFTLFWRESYHFFNTPISAENTCRSNPFVTMRNMGIRESDFVSFKLDVDTPKVEIPIALESLKNKEFSNLVDEFFFELHFRCEFLMAAWGSTMPESAGDFKLNRVGALELFSDLRKNGVR